jgi:cell division protein FtsQ
MIGQVAKSYKDLKFSLKLSAKILSFAAFLFCVSLSFNHLHFANYFPIREVKIAGANYSDHSDMQSALLPLVNKGFFKVDVVQIQQRLLQFPWVSEVSVRRVWPQSIDIEIVEKNSLARWNDLGLLSTTGEIFNPNKISYPKELPQFKGPPGTQMQMLNYYDIIDSLISPLECKIVEMELTDAHAWHIILSNGIKLNLGYKDILTRMEHFVKVYPKIVGSRASRVDYVDLRYSNGLAVHWKT